MGLCVDTGVTGETTDLAETTDTAVGAEVAETVWTVLC